MRFKKRSLLRSLVLFVFVMISANTADAQVSFGSDVQARFSVAVQPRFMYGRESSPRIERVGFGLRRARLRTTVVYKESVGMRLHLDFAGGSASAVDLYGFYQASPRVRFRVGYFAGAQPRALIPTSFTVSDGPDRIAISDRWARSTIGAGGRDLGVDVEYADDGNRLSLFVHNGDGSLSRSNFRTGIGGLMATGGTEQHGLAVSTSASRQFKQIKGLELGAFLGHNSSKNPNTSVDSDASRGRDYNTFSLHLYWGATPGSQPVRLKGDVIGTFFVGNGLAPAQSPLGYSVTAAARLSRGFEAVATFEAYEIDVDATPDRYVMAGINYSPSARRGLPFHQERLTIAYLSGIPGTDAADTQHQVVVQLQLAMW